MKAAVTIVMTTRKGAPDQGVAFTVDSKLGLADARKAIRRALTEAPAAAARTRKGLTPEQQARRAEKARLEAERDARRKARLEKQRAEHRARSEKQREKDRARAEKQRDKDRARSEREAGRKERQEKKDAVAARKAARDWVKGIPQPGDAVEYQEKPKGRRHVGRVKNIVGAETGTAHYRIAGDKGLRLYPEALVRRTLKPVR